MRKHFKKNLLYETMLSKLGSRLILNPKPNKSEMNQGLLGFYYDKPVQTTFAIYYEDLVYYLPFTRVFQKSSDNISFKLFDHVTQKIGLTHVSYHCRANKLPFEVVFTIFAPFYPQDVKLSIAPFFYMTVKIHNLEKKEVKGSILIAMDNIFGGEFPTVKGRHQLFKNRNLIGFKFTDSQIEKNEIIVSTTGEDVTYAIGDLYQTLYHDFSKKGKLNNTIDDRFMYLMPSGLSWEFSLKPGEEKEKIFVYAGFYHGNALRIQEKHSKFIYTKYFKGIDDVIAYAFKDYKEIMGKVNLFESIISNSSIPESMKNLIDLAFQTYVANTWWTYSGKEQYFTVWEGVCRFHSTLDVAYNLEIFSLLFWPELLKKQLETWSHYTINGYLAHDIGDDRYICRQTYDHDMPCEENADYVLLLYAYWRMIRKSSQFVKDKYILVKKLLEYLIFVDIDNDGIPDVPMAVRNTVDMGSYAVQNASGQTYLGVKCLAAFLAGKEFANWYKDKRFEKKYINYANKIVTTLKEKSWQKDHFAICLDEKAVGRKKCSMYAVNGLLYLLLTDTHLPINPSYFIKDIETHTKRLMRTYGCVHSEIDSVTWITQNIWRDIIGLYLGIDTLKNASKYWKFQLKRNLSFGGAYTDIYYYKEHRADLERYPQGVASFGYLYALGGIIIDRLKSRIRFSPRKTNLNIPIVTEANWEDKVIPHLSFYKESNRVEFIITNFDRLSRYKCISIEIPTSKKPTKIQFGSTQAQFLLNRILKRTISISEQGINFHVEKISKDINRNLWITELSVKMTKPTQNNKILLLYLEHSFKEGGKEK